MSKSKLDMSEVISIAMYQLAFKGSAKAYNVDLSAIEKLSGAEVSIDVLLALAMVGCESKEETNFVESVWSAIEAIL